MLYGVIVFIKKNGTDGSRFPVTITSLKIGRTDECVIRIQNPSISPEHCHLTIDKNGQAKLRNLSKHSVTFLNDVPLGKGDHLINEGDMIRIGDRYARWEYNPSSKYLNPEHSKVEETHFNSLHKRKSEGAFGISKAKKVDKRRYSEIGATIEGLGSLGETLKISVGSTKVVARRSLELQKLGLCPQVKIKRCSMLASHVSAVTRKNGTPIRTSETWEVKSVSPDESGKLTPRKGTRRKDTPIKKLLEGQSVARNSCQAPNIQPIPEDSPVTRKTSLERIRLDDVPECTTPSGPTKSSAKKLTSSSKKQRRASKVSTPSNVLSTSVEKKKVKSPSLSNSCKSVRNVKFSKTEKTPDNQSSKRKLSAVVTAERAAKKLKTIEPAKPDENKKAALLVLGKASSNKNSFWKDDITSKSPEKNAVTKQDSVEYNNIRKKSKLEERKSLKPTSSSPKTESPGKRKGKSSPSESVKSRGSKVSVTGKNSYENDVTDSSPGKCKKAVVILDDCSKTGRISCSSERSTPKKRVRDNIVTSASTSKIMKKGHGFSNRGSRSSPRNQLNVSNGSSFELNEIRTPDVTLDWFISPLSSTKSPKGSSPKVGKGGDSEVKVAKKEEETLGVKSRKKDLTKMKGVRRLLVTPKQQKSPKNDLTDVRGVRRLMGTPKQQKSPKNDLRDVRGVKKLMATPKQQKSPKNDLRDVRGVKKLMATPKQQKSPKNDLTDVRGVKKLMATPKQQKSPKNDLTDVRGVKKLMATPKQQKSPKNDLTDVRGVRRLMGTPKQQKSPKNDLTDVRGVRKLMGTPKQQKSPKNDLTDVRGVRKLMGTPKQQKSPKNDLTDVEGVSKLFSSIEDEGNADVSIPEAGKVVASAVESRITRKTTRRTTKAVPTETEIEGPVVRRSTRRTRPINVEEEVEKSKRSKPERKVTKKAVEIVAKPEKLIETETVTRITTRSASKRASTRLAGKK